MNSLTNWHKAVAVAVICVCGGGLYLELTTAHTEKVQSAALTTSQTQLQGAIKALEAVADGVTATLKNINRQCNGPHGPDACGMLAQVNESVIRIDDAVTTMQTQVKNTGVLTDVAAKGLARASDDIHDTSVKLQETAGAATKTLSAATDSLDSLKRLIEQLKADAAGLQTTETSLTTLIDEAQPVAVNMQGITSDGHRITKDAADEADKLAHPPKKKLGFWGGFWVGCQYAHKMMPSIF